MEKAGDYWEEELAEDLNSTRPDAILLGGDILDLYSETTIEKTV